MKTSRIPVLILISVIILIFSVSMFLGGCGRRARIARALQEQESESVTEQSTEEDVIKEETTEFEAAAEEEDVSMEETAELEETTELTTEESMEEAEEPEGEVAEEDLSEDEEEDQVEGVEQFTADIPLVGSECGSIIRFPEVAELEDQALIDILISPGDSSQNSEVRSLISFDISGLTGVTVIESRISATAEGIQGTPFATYGPLLIKSVYWGPGEFTPADFNLDGVELGNFLKKNFGIQNRNLKEDLQRAIDVGHERYQLIFYFEMDGTDEDSEGDNVRYWVEDITLNVTYNQ